MTFQSPFLSLREVIALTKLSRTTIYRRTADGRFPKAISLGGRRVAYMRTEVERWAANPAEYVARPD